MKKNVKIFVFSTVASLLSMQALAQAKSAAFDSISPERGHTEIISRADANVPNDVAVLFNYDFINASRLNATDPLRALLDIKDDERIFLTKAMYALPINPDSLNARIFKDPAITQYLLGEHYKLTRFTKNPFGFHGDRKISYMLVVNTDVESDTVLDVYQPENLPESLSSVISQLGADDNKALKQVVYQRMSRFNQYMTQSFMLTLIYANGVENSSNVILYSGALMKDLNMPEGIVKDEVQRIANQDLVGYVKRLLNYK